MERNIVCYCTSGLGNRLRPLASCYAIAKATGRRLLVYWDTMSPNGCLAKFNELFTNQLDMITLNEIEQLEGCSLFTENGPGHSCAREASLYGRKALSILASKSGTHNTQDYKENDSTNIVIYEDNFLKNSNLDDAKLFLKSLKPIDTIQKNIDKYTTQLGLDKSIIGAHARGTDFGSSVEYYLALIRKHAKEGKKIFLSTEDPEYEAKIIATYPNIIYRKKQFYTFKEPSATSWHEPTSYYNTTERVMEAVEDLYLLAKTNIKIFHPGSTFCKIARILS